MKPLILGLCLLAPCTGLAAADDPAKALRYGSPEAREAAVDEVLAGRGAGSGGALLEVLGDAQGVLRLKVVRALGVLKEDGAVKPLEALLLDPESEIRLAAARSLGRIADPAACPDLVKAFGAQDEEVREAAARAVGDCGCADRANALIALLKDRNRMVREAAVDALGMLGTEAGFGALEGQLGDSDPSFKRHVVNAIGAHRGEKVVLRLGAWLNDKDPYLRGFAAEALAKRPPVPSLTPALVGLLEDPVYAVRVRSVEALGAWRQRSAVSALIKCLRASEPTLRWKAVQALGDIGDPAAKEALDYLASHDAEPEIRSAAAKARQALN
jgi:HEAT repeat protein